jgi:predicted RNase H-like HicB family nuclease
MNIPYPVLLYPSPEGGFVAEVPQLKGCLAQGETEAECLEELEVVLEHWLSANSRKPIPKPDTDRFLDQIRNAVNS